MPNCDLLHFPSRDKYVETSSRIRVRATEVEKSIGIEFLSLARALIGTICRKV